jgi:glycosyltransferase involved in cell wall biosynthesis
MSLNARMRPSLDIIIVNWNAGGSLGACLSSIRAAHRDSFELKRMVVVDNASSDGSAENLHFADLSLSLLKNTDNQGFAAACNQGARDSSADYLLFLNPDVRVLADSLQAPIQLMEESRNSEVGICGIQLLDEEGNVALGFQQPPVFSLRCLVSTGSSRITSRDTFLAVGIISNLSEWIRLWVHSSWRVIHYLNHWVDLTRDFSFILKIWIFPIARVRQGGSLITLQRLRHITRAAAVLNKQERSGCITP